MINILKELYQNCPDTMFLIKTIVVSSLFAAFLVLAPSEVVIPVMGVIAPIVFIIGLIIWSFRKERHIFDRDKPKYW